MAQLLFVGEEEMRETIIALLITAAFAAATIQAIRHGQQVADLEHAVTVLEREVAARQLMLDDLHRIVPIMERRVVQVETDRTAREVIWHLQEAIGNCENVEVY